MSLQTFCSLLHQEIDHDAETQLRELRSIFRIVAIFIISVGVSGNILNFITLRSPSLQTVPFMYIRALAVFDILGLTAILIHYSLPTISASYMQIIYSTYIEDVLINSFLVAGLYCALLLTIERYVLIANPHTNRHLNPVINARIKIVFSFVLALVLHSPIALQNAIKHNKDGSFHKGNNQDLLCTEPYFTTYNYYKVIRELIRLLCVLTMISLNVIITRKLQIQKRNRRQMVLRNNVVAVEPGTQPSTSPARERQSRRDTNLLRSFTEKKLTALMIAICFIYVVGNLPQTGVMILQSETTEDLYGFQVYRNVANTLEVLNHCVNFFIFCMASRDYRRAFLSNCRCLRRVLKSVPFCDNFFRRQRMNSTTDQISQNTTSSQYHLVGLTRKSLDSASKTTTTQLRDTLDVRKYSEDCGPVTEVRVVINFKENSEGDHLL